MCLNMPLIRKVCKVGTGEAVFIPKSWIRFLEEKHDQPIVRVAIEVNEVLKISPIIERKRSAHGD